jgi:hypothetical protein
MTESLDLAATETSHTVESIPELLESTKCLRGEPWYDDGSIILQADATQFKVYRGILANSSVVFKDMTALPQPIAGEEMIEGCPVVRLTDTARDWSHVLKALCDRR